MTKYRCIQRLTTDNHKTIHEVGDIVDLTGEEEKSAVFQKAVELVEDESTAPTATVIKASKQTSVDPGVAAMENEGGTPS